MLQMYKNIKKNNLALFSIIIVLVFLGCQESGKSNDSTDISPEKVDKTVVTETKTIEKSFSDIIQDIGYQNLKETYAVDIIYNFLDTVHGKHQETVFLENLQELVSHKYKNLFTFRFLKNDDITRKILAIENHKPYVDKVLSKNKSALCIAIEVHNFDKQIKMRRYDSTIKDHSPLIISVFKNRNEIATIVTNNIGKIFSFAGFIIKDEDHNTIVFRGNPQILKKLENLPTSTFAIFRNNRKVADSFVVINSIKISGIFYTATAKILGEYRPQGFEKVSPIFFTGGAQNFQLVDADGNPQEGFSIFTSYEDFAYTENNYITTTGLSGDFVLEDKKKAPIFLTIAKNMKGVNFPIVKKCIMVENVGEIVQIKAETLQDIQVDSSQQLSSKQIQQIKNEIAERIIQAKDYIDNNEYEKAMIALEYGKKILVGLPDQKNLQEIIKKVTKLYEQALQQKKDEANKKKSIELLEQADKKIVKLSYKEVHEILVKAKKLWPYPYSDNKAYQEILKRIKRIETLLIEEKTPIGVARIYLTSNLHTLNTENITVEDINKIKRLVTELCSQDFSNEYQIYDDRFLLINVRTFLDQLANEFIEIAKVYLDSYKKGETESIRTELREKYDMNYMKSKKLDDILQLLQKI